MRNKLYFVPIWNKFVFPQVKSFFPKRETEKRAYFRYNMIERLVKPIDLQLRELIKDFNLAFSSEKESTDG